MVIHTPNEVLEAMLSKIHVMVAYLDLDFRFVRVNDAYAQAGSHPPEFFAGKSHFDLYPDEENEAIFRRVAETGETFVTFARPFCYADQPERGVTFWDWTLTRVADESGQPCGLLFTLVDVTERQRAHLALEESLRRIEELNDSLELLVEERTAQLRDMVQELEAFSYSVSHDLRAPVHAIRGFAELLADNHVTRLDEHAKRLVERIRGGTATMIEMIDSLLALSQATLADMQTERVDMSALARQVAAEITEIAPGPRVDVSIAEGLRVEADPALLRILLANLLSNAFKFTAKSPEPRIEVGSIERNGETWFFVRDNGAGFDMKQASRLFVPFQRLHGRKHFEGTGVGLATVQRVVRRHGGSVHAEGHPGAGATFLFRFGQPPHEHPTP
jgi:PAS domain S-box-containing protein